MKKEIQAVLRCTPFLLFDGNCAEAMTFYHACLGGELTMSKLGDTELRHYLPAEKHNRIINAHLKSGGLEISATDWMASPEFDPVQGNTSAIFVTGNDYDEMRDAFDKLKDGKNNSRLQELHDMPMGSTASFLTSSVFSGFSYAVSAICREFSNAFRTFLTLASRVTSFERAQRVRPMPQTSRRASR